MQALVLSTAEKTAIIQKIPIPAPGPYELQVKVSVVALNPVDALYTANPLGSSGRTVGSDFAGTVSARGSHVQHVKLDQRVAGFLQGACSVNDRNGAFAEYLVAPHDLVWFVPDDMSLADASTISLCALTAAQALYCRLGLRQPFAGHVGGSEKASAEVQILPVRKHPLKVLIYGASTSVGLYAAQLVRLSAEASRVPIFLYGAASRKRHGMLLNYPYSYAGLVDYSDDDWPTQIRKMTLQEGVNLAFDCISEGDSVARVAATLATGGKIAIVRSREGGAWEADEKDLPSEPLYGAAWEGLGEKVEYQGFTIPASSKARDFTVEFYKYLSNSPMYPNPVRHMPGGLERIVQDGFALLGPGVIEQRATDRREEWMRPIGGEKLVYKISPS